MDAGAFFHSELTVHADVARMTRDVLRGPFGRLVGLCVDAAAVYPIVDALRADDAPAPAKDW